VARNIHEEVVVVAREERAIRRGQDPLFCLRRTQAEEQACRDSQRDPSHTAEPHLLKLRKFLLEHRHVFGLELLPNDDLAIIDIAINPSN